MRRGARGCIGHRMALRDARCREDDQRTDCEHVPPVAAFEDTEHDYPTEQWIDERGQDGALV